MSVLSSQRGTEGDRALRHLGVQTPRAGAKPEQREAYVQRQAEYIAEAEATQREQRDATRARRA